MTIEKNERPLDTIDEAIEAIRNGEVVIVVDVQVVVENFIH